MTAKDSARMRPLSNLGAARGDKAAAAVKARPKSGVITAGAAHFNGGTMAEEAP